MDPGEQLHIRIKGIVFPIEWDRRGNIIQVAIRSEDFETFIIDIATNSDMLNSIDQVVEVEALIVGEDVFGQKIIRLQPQEIQKPA